MTLDGGRVGYIEAAGFMCPKTEIASPAPRVYLYLGGNQFVWSVYWLCHPESAPVLVPACPSDALFACTTGLIPCHRKTYLTMLLAVPSGTHR